MKKYLALLILILMTSCATKKFKRHIKKLPNDKLVELKRSIENENQFLKVQYILDKIENTNYPHRCLKKIPQLKEYWSTVPELITYYEIWKVQDKNRSLFQNNEEPEFARINKLYRNRELELNEFYKIHQNLVKTLIAKYPNIYPDLIEKQTSTLKKMKLESAKFMLSEYKKKELYFPTNWIPKKENKTIENSCEFKKREKKIILINSKINNIKQL